VKNSIVLLLISLFALFIGCEEDAAESEEIQKVYITLQNADKVAVVDGETG